MNFLFGFNFSCHVSRNVCNKAVSMIEEQMNTLPGFGIHVIVSSKSVAQTVYDVLSMKYSSRMITSDNSKEEQVSVAKEWSEGRFDMLVSTTVALVGNENVKCRSVIVVGMLFNLFSVVQAFCRLRPKQRLSGGLLAMIVPPITADMVESHVKKDTASANSLISRGILSEEKPPDFNKVGTLVSVCEWINEDVGCRIASLCKRFGTERSSCEVCDNCRGTATVLSSSRATSALSQETQQQNRALIVLRLMERQCIACQSPSCDGESCLQPVIVGAKVCCCCGQNHWKNECDVKWSEILNGRGCYCCCDLRNRIEYRRHESYNCPLKNRMKRLMIEAYRDQSKYLQMSTFASLILSGTREYCKFLSICGMQKVPAENKTVSTVGRQVVNCKQQSHANLTDNNSLGSNTNAKRVSENGWQSTRPNTNSSRWCQLDLHGQASVDDSSSDDEDILRAAESKRAAKPNKRQKSANNPFSSDDSSEDDVANGPKTGKDGSENESSDSDDSSEAASGSLK